MARLALLFVMMTFFAGLALDISMPAVVLSLMALSNVAVARLSGSRSDAGFGQEASA